MIFSHVFRVEFNHCSVLFSMLESYLLNLGQQAVIFHFRPLTNDSFLENSSRSPLIFPQRKFPHSFAARKDLDVFLLLDQLDMSLRSMSSLLPGRKSCCDIPLPVFLFLQVRLLCEDYH